MAQSSVSAFINAPVEAVFAYVDDYHNSTRYMEGLVAWEPVGELRGVGTIFQGALKAGPMTLRFEVEITELVENEIISWKSHSGISNNGTWTFEPEGDGTKVTFMQDFILPGWGAGKLVAKSLEPIIKAQSQQSMNALRRQVEELHAKAGVVQGHR